MGADRQRYHRDRRGSGVGIAGFMLVAFWRGASLVQTITKAITDSEERLRNENRLLADKIESLRVDVAVLSAKLEERAPQGRAPQQFAEFDPAQLASLLGPKSGSGN